MQELLWFEMKNMAGLIVIKTQLFHINLKKVPIKLL